MVKQNGMNLSENFWTTFGFCDTFVWLTYSPSCCWHQLRLVPETETANGRQSQSPRCFLCKIHWMSGSPPRVRRAKLGRKRWSPAVDTPTRLQLFVLLRTAGADQSSRANCFDPSRPQLDTRTASPGRSFCRRDASSSCENCCLG